MNTLYTEAVIPALLAALALGLFLWTMRLPVRQSPEARELERLRPVLQQALDALEVAHAGLEWYRDAQPETINGSDEEADEVMGNAMQALRDALGRAAPQPAQEI